MTTFGFSAFLKLLNLNERPRRTEIRGRLNPRGGGYDFHKRTRQLATSYLVEGVSLEESLEQAALIVNPAERRSAQAALQTLARWRGGHPGRVIDLQDREYESPAGIFKVRFSPDFGISIGGQTLAVHIWNTMTPPLQRRLVRAALSLFSPLYSEAVDDLAVLSLRTGELIRLGDPTDAIILAGRVVDVIEETFIDLRDEGPRPDGEIRPLP